VVKRVQSWLYLLSGCVFGHSLEYIGEVGDVGFVGVLH